jgi:predicted DCC family thiol-disulfide oxidoreductase YuxK
MVQMMEDFCDSVHGCHNNHIIMNVNEKVINREIKAMNGQALVDTHSKIILFDGVCNLCAAWVHFVIKRDPQQKFKLASVQSAEGQMLLQWCGLPVTQYDTMVYIENGQAYFRSTAFLHIIQHFGALWPLLSWGRIVPRVIRDWLYDRIALNRYRLFGKRTVCLMPSPSLAQHFLSIS